MAIVFDVVAKACTEATSLLKLCCMATSGGLDLPLGAGAAGFDFAAGGGCIYTRGVLVVGYFGVGQWQWDSTSWGFVEG